MGKHKKLITWALLIAFAIYLSNGLRHQAITGIPDWVDACGRSYGGPREVLTREQAITPDLEIVGNTQIWLWHKNVWSLPLHDVQGGNPMCGFAIYVEFGPDEFRSYSLKGGP